MRTLRIEFLEAGTSSDGQGGRVGTMEPVYACQAEYEPVKVPRWLQASQPALPTSHRFVIWKTKTYVPGVDTMIDFEGERLTIQSVTPFDEARTRLTLIATSNGQRSTDTGAK